ncbi:unnamed protein product [Sphagnum tenellum]
MRPFSRDANNYSQAQITKSSGVLLNLPPNSKPQCGSSSNGVPNLHFSWSPKSVTTCSLLSQFQTSSVA